MEKSREKFKSEKERFENKFIPEPNSGCWLWIGTNNRGYGSFFSERKLRSATRVSLRLHRNLCVLAEYDVCHKCDTPMCVNPDHLWIGTTKENMNDMVNKGRCSKLCGSAVSKVLTEDDVRAILLSQDSQRKIAKRHGVSRRTVTFIQHRVTWRHVHV